jgi:hypothetical protein
MIRIGKPISGATEDPAITWEMDGNKDRHRIDMALRSKDRNQFPVLNRGFHLISEVQPMSWRQA